MLSRKIARVPTRTIGVPKKDLAYRKTPGAGGDADGAAHERKDGAKRNSHSGVGTILTGKPTGAAGS
jgi:hypothetical protein